MEHVNGWCFRGIYKGGLWENDLHVSAHKPNKHGDAPQHKHSFGAVSVTLNPRSHHCTQDISCHVHVEASNS